MYENRGAVCYYYYYHLYYHLLPVVLVYCGKVGRWTLHVRCACSPQASGPLTLTWPDLATSRCQESRLSVVVVSCSRELPVPELRPGNSQAIKQRFRPPPPPLMPKFSLELVRMSD